MAKKKSQAAKNASAQAASVDPSEDGDNTPSSRPSDAENGYHHGNSEDADPTHGADAASPDTEIAQTAQMNTIAAEQAADVHNEASGEEQEPASPMRGASASPMRGDRQIWDLIHAPSEVEDGDLPPAPKTSDGDMSQVPATVTIPLDAVKNMMHEDMDSAEGDELKVALAKKEKECEIWKSRANQLQEHLEKAKLQLKAVQLQLSEERRLNSSVRDVELSHPSVQEAMEAVRLELASSRKDYSRAKALNQELQAQVDALLGSDAALDALQKGKRQLERENFELKSHIEQLQGGIGAARESGNWDGEHRLLGSRRLNHALEVVLDPNAAEQVSDNEKFLGSRRLGALASIFAIPGIHQPKRAAPREGGSDDDLEIVT